MKIIIDGRLYGLENAGLGRYLINLVSSLTKFDVHNNYVLLLRKKYFDNLELPSNWKKVLADFKHYSFAEQFKLPSIIKKENPDLVHFPHFNVPIFYKGKYIVTIHDMLMHKSVGLNATTLSAPMYFIRRLGYRIAFDNAIKHAVKIVVPSNSVKNELREFYKIRDSKIVVTYEGVDPKIKSEKRCEIEKPYFIYAGNAYPHKNLERVIKSMIILNTNYKQTVKLAIASSRGIFTQRLEKVINKNLANKYVQLLGFVNDSQLYYLYEDSLAYISASLSEGFGLPGLEAMSVGTLVIASDIPVFREIYKDNAEYFDPFDPNSIEQSMKKVLTMEKIDREKRIRKAKEFVKIYSWDKMARETLQIYESCNSVRQSK